MTNFGESSDGGAIEDDLLQASALLDAGKPEEAINLLDGLLPGSMEDSRIYRGLAIAFKQAEQLLKAIEVQQFAILLEPESLPDLAFLGDLCNQAGEVYDAEAIFRDVIERAPSDPYAYIGLAEALSGQGRISEAVVEANRSIQLAPDHWQGYAALGYLFYQLGQADCALIAYERALMIEPCKPRLHCLRSIARLSAFDLHGGWPEYQWRFFFEEWKNPLRYQDIPLWDGQSRDRRLWVWREQGIGDEIFHYGFLQELIEKGYDIVLEVDPRMVSICERSFPRVAVISIGSSLPKIDECYSLPLGSIGMHFSPSLGLALRRKIPYLVADPDRVVDLRRSLQDRPSHFTIGISWMSHRPSLGVFKSISLGEFLPISCVPFTRLVNLQYGKAEEQIESFNLQAENPIIDLPFNKTTDLESLAALVTACDLVITISNVTAHLACALGKPCWILLPAGRGLLWYWHLHGSVSPWYPTARLYRQPSVGGWQDVMESLQKHLNDFIPQPPNQRNNQAW